MVFRQCSEEQLESERPALENADLGVGRGKDNYGGWIGVLEPDYKSHYMPH